MPRTPRTRRRPSTPLAALAAATLVLAACRPAEPAAALPAPPAAPPTAAQPATPDQGRSTMTTLAQLLYRYASAPTPAWGVFDAPLEGVEWSEAQPSANPDGRPPNTHSRSGRLVLAGFGETDLPNGRTGPDADYERGNEGRSGVTLNGTASEVMSIAVMKFYPDADYADVLRRQLPQGQVERIAGPCALAEGTTSGEANTTRNEFFEITLAAGGTLYAEGSVDAEGGKYSPGSTTYFFYRSKPTGRIEQMQCKAA